MIADFGARAGNHCAKSPSRAKGRALKVFEPATMPNAEFLNIEDFHLKAKESLSKEAYDYYASGAHDEITLKANKTAFSDIELFYKVLVDVRERDLSTEVLGHTLSMPVMLSPTAFHGLANIEGEVATARAAREAGTVMTLSTLSNKPIEEVAKAAVNNLWFQLYVYKDRGATEALVHRAEAAGAKALVVTVDAPELGCREADVRNRFSLPEGLVVSNLLAQGAPDKSHLPAQAGSGLAAYFASLIENSLTWKDLEWLRSICSLPILIKGVVRADDARRAIDYGANGIIVSNHGGRQLDTSPPTIRALKAISEEVGKELTVLLDGGIRRGTDVIKALALGAQAVMIGRPVLWGLASDGASGVRAVLELFRKEIDLAMALCGTPRVKDIGLDLLEPHTRN